MPEITLKWDGNAVPLLKNKAMERALVRAVGKAGGDAARLLKTGSSRLLRQRKKFKVARINRAMQLHYPSSRKSLRTLVWRLNIRGEPMPLADLPVRQARKGVMVQVNTGKRTLLRHAFIATMRSGHRGVFQRVQGKRLPIREAFTTRITDPFNDQGFTEYVQDGANALFQSAFDRLLPIELAKAANDNG